MKKNYFGVEIDLSRDGTLSDFASTLLNQYYMLEDEDSPQEAFARAAIAYSEGDDEFAQRIYDYVSKGWFMYASPVLSNAPRPGEAWRALPISCFLGWVEDTLEGLIDHSTELRWLSVKGGGVGGHWSSIRSVSDKSPGPIPFLKTVDADMNAFRQGKCYHPDVEVLTDRGYIKFPDLTDLDKVAQVSSSGEVSFVKPIELVKEYHNGSLIRVVDEKNVDIMVTPNHSMVIDRKTKDGWNNDFQKIRADLLPSHSEVRMAFSGKIKNDNKESFSNSDRLLVAFQADGTNYNGKSIEFHLKKQRKIDRLLRLVRESNYSYNLIYRNDGTCTIGVKVSGVRAVPDVSSSAWEAKDLSWVKPETRSYEWLMSFLDEVSNWDSCKRATNFTYSSTNKSCANVVFTAATLAGKRARIKEQQKEYPRKNSFYVVVSNKNHFTTQGVRKEEIPYDGHVYCALVPEGRLLVRSNGRPLVCGNTRKGSYAAYLDVSHPDIIEFLQMRIPTGGDPNRKCFNLHNAVNITDDFMNAAIEDREWNLIDPADGTVRDSVGARELLQRIIETRYRTGEPYLHFIDTSNRALPQPLKDLGLRINGSNLCSEIFLPTNSERTAVCCLSSLNLSKWDEWKDTNIVQDLIRMLDNVLDTFINHAPKELWKAINSAKRERSIGLGAMGFHDLLQKNNIPWESAMATGLNKSIFEDIKARAVEGTQILAKEKGPYPDGPESGRRNAHLMAIAPNANSSIISDTSPSIEPWKSNAYTHRTRAGSFLVKNPELEKVLDKYYDEKGKEEAWNSVILNQGSVQHLDVLSDWEKQVFKTAFELDQRWVVEHSGARQEFICQGQSVNLFFPAGSDKNYVLMTHIKAWKMGLKALYYLRTNAGVDPEKVSAKVERVALADYAGEEEECLSCQG